MGWNLFRDPSRLSPYLSFGVSDRERAVQQTKESRSGAGRLAGILIAFAFPIGSALYVLVLDDQAEVAVDQRPLPLPPVSVITVEASIAEAEARSYAQIKPLWSAELRANASGRVTEVTDQALAGRRVREGDLLVAIEDAALIADLRSAELILAEAEVALTDAKNQTDLRRRQARAAPNLPQTEFSLLLPQLRLAETELISAEAQVAAARVALQNAEVRAPFDGYVSARSVSPGQRVSPGDVLLSIVDGTRFELETGLSSNEWRLLRHPLGGAEVAVLSLRGDPLGIARVREAGGFRDEDTREFKVFLEVARPEDGPQDVQLLSGDLVELVFSGESFENVLRVPESSLTRSGDIWHVGPGNLLARFTPDILWQSGGEVVLHPPNDDRVFRIAAEPLASFLAGTEVDPVMTDRR